MFTRKIFEIIYGLSQTQPWANTDSLEHLLFEDCSNEDEREMIIQLVSRFHYFDNESYDELVNSLAEEIASDPLLAEESTQVVAMARDRGSDSSQQLLYELKILFEYLGWRKYKHVNRADKAYDTFKKSPAHKNIVLIDEFVGSGKTVAGRVKEIRQSFKDANVSDYSIKVRCLVSSIVGVDHLKHLDIDFHPLVVIEKGISDFYPPELADSKIQSMKKIESLLSTQYNGRHLHSLGYGETESLYCREKGNTPNSVFPVFWWPFYKNEKERKTLLKRAMADA